MGLQDLRPPLDRLVRRGDALGLRNWRERELDYVTEFGLTPADVPDLVAIVRLWADEENLPADENLWAGPVHAWRALAQLTAIEVVQPLLDMLAKLDAEQDDWYLDEFPDVFGMVGPPAIPALANYLSDRTKPEFPRICTADGLGTIAKLHVESRLRVVEILTSELAANAPGQYDLNGFLIAHLRKLQAVESAEVIERAFAANVVDESVAGNWSEVRAELGVEGLGLVPDRPRASPSARFASLLPDDGWRVDGPGDRDRQRTKAKKLKAKRKQQQQSRRRNRRAK